MEISLDTRICDRTNVVRNNLLSAFRTGAIGPFDALISLTTMTVRDRRSERDNWCPYVRSVSFEVPLDARGLASKLRSLNQLRLVLKALLYWTDRE